MRKNLPIALLGIMLMALVCVSGYTDPRRQDGARASIAGSETSHPGHEAQATGQMPMWRILIAWPEGAGTLAVLCTLFFIGWQAILMRQTVAAAEDTSKRDLRAYVSVVIGTAIFQERRPKDKGGDLRFECQPVLKNTGKTPARNVRFKARAAIMAAQLPKEVNLPDVHDEGVGGTFIGPEQNATMFAIVDGFCADYEVDDIKYFKGSKALFVWGLVLYEDVYGEEHFVRFCHRIYWDLKDTVRGHYMAGRNDAD